MNGEVVGRYVIDDKDVERAFRQIEKRGQENVTTMGRYTRDVKESFRRNFTEVGNIGRSAFVGLAASGAAFGKAMSAYADKNSDFKNELEGLKGASQGLWEDIGRDISTGGIGPITGFVNGIRAARQATVDFLAGQADLVTEGGAAGLYGSKGDLSRQAENQQQEYRRMVSARDKVDAAKAGALDSKGDTVGAAELRAQITLRQQLRAINADEVLGKDAAGKGQVEAALRAEAAGTVAKAKADAKARDDKAAGDARAAVAAREQTQLQREADQARGLGLKDQAEMLELYSARTKDIAAVENDSKLSTQQKADELGNITAHYDRMDQIARQTQNDEKKHHKEDLDTRLKGMEIDGLRQAGRLKEADLAKVALEYDREALEISRDRNLTAKERAEAIARLGKVRSDAEGFINTKDYEERTGRSQAATLGVGQFSAGLSRLVFGGSGGSNDPAVKKIDEGNKILKTIAQNTGRPQLAVMGP